MKLSAILLRACGMRKWKPSSHYAECRRRAEQRLGDLSWLGEPICEQCAGQQVRRVAWWRLVYAIAGTHRCATCGREFAVTRRATGTAELAATEMDRLTPSQREHFDAQMALMRRRFDETHRQPTGVEYGTWPVPGAPFDEPQQEARRCVAR